MSGAFAGFGPQALPFLKALAFHQTREWFEQNRHLHETDLRAPLGHLLADLSAEFTGLGLPLRGDAKSIFRLHRDTRFGKDKRPHKTNAGAVMSRDGTKRSQGFLYLHLDPEGCFAAAGFWRPEPAELLSIRRMIAHGPDAYRQVVAQLGAAKLEQGDGDPLARLPKGFETTDEPDIAAAVRMRHFIVRRPIPAARLRSPDLARDLVTFARDAEPLLRFGWKALGA